MKSALYEGIITHHRREPVEHRFSYRIALPLLHLDEVEEVCAMHPLWSNGHPNIVSFRSRDYLGDGSEQLQATARGLAQETLGISPEGPVALLAHPRTIGWLFNPISLFYCYNSSGTDVEALVCEVTNTPWHERHIYAVGGPGTHRFGKAMHVSPFLGMDMEYELEYEPPGTNLSVTMRNVRGNEVLFSAAMRLKRTELDRAALGKLIFSYPFTTMRVSAGIYRQAFALWRAGATFVPHPRKSESGDGGTSQPGSLGHRNGGKRW